MSSLEDYDGLCGIIDIHSNSDLRIRCKYEFGHQGPHSYEVDGKRAIKYMSGGILISEIKERAAKGSIAAQVMLETIKNK